MKIWPRNRKDSGSHGSGPLLAEQARIRGVKDERVLGAIAAVPREIFMPEESRGQANLDEAFPIGEGQTISQPTLVARMTELLEPKSKDIVLEIGAGSGYQAALLAGLVRHVHAIEIRPGLAQAATERLFCIGVKNVTVHVADGYEGFIEAAPYDGIVVSCAVDRAPEPLVNQLKPGGRMVLPLGSPWHGQRLTRLIKETNGTLKTEHYMGVRFVPLTGPHGTSI